VLRGRHFDKLTSLPCTAAESTTAPWYYGQAARGAALALSGDSDRTKRRELPELPAQVRAGLAEGERECHPFAHRIVEIVARTSPLRTLATRMTPRPNPQPFGPRVLWGVAPEPPDYPGRRDLLWQLAMQPLAQRPRNLRPHEPGWTMSSRVPSWTLSRR